MDTFLEMIQAVQSDLTVGDESVLFPLATVKLAINRAYSKSGGLFRWPDLEDAKKTSTQANQEYYDFPSTWRPDSIWRLEVDNTQWGEDPDGSPMSYDDYMVWRADTSNASSTEKKWAVQHTRYFIFPVPTTAGSYNISVWGYKNVETLTDDTDETIFSYSLPECNEAVVLEAVAILKGKGEEDKSGQFRSAEAKAILAMAWTKIKQEQAKYEKDQPFFYVTDMFSGKNSGAQNTGNFD
jgi:hypothetical protein